MFFGAAVFFKKKRMKQENYAALMLIKRSGLPTNSLQFRNLYIAAAQQQQPLILLLRGLLVPLLLGRGRPLPQWLKLPLRILIMSVLCQRILLGLYTHAIVSSSMCLCNSGAGPCWFFLYRSRCSNKEKGHRYGSNNDCNRHTGGCRMSERQAQRYVR